MDNPEQRESSRTESGGFRRNAVIAVTSAVIGRGLGLALLPVLSRLYPPEDPGVFNLFVSMYAVALPLTTFRFELAIVLPERDRAAAALARICAYAAGMATVLSAVLLLFVRDAVARLAGVEAIGDWILLAPLFLGLHGLSLAADYWLIRRSRFGPRLVAAPLSALLTTGVPIALALSWGPSPVWLVIGALLGHAASCLVLSVSALRSEGLVLFEPVSLASMRDAVRQWRAYPTYMTPYSLAQAAVERATLFLIAAWGSSAALGLFVYARRLAWMPVNTVVDGLRQALYARLRTNRDSESNGAFVAGILSPLALVQAASIAWGVVAAPPVVDAILGAGWTGAGDWFRWLVIPGAVLIATGWLDRIFDVFGRQRLAVALQLVSDAVNLGALIGVLIWTGSPLVAIAVWSLMDAAYNLVWLGIAWDVAAFERRLYYRWLARLVGWTSALTLAYGAVSMLLSWPVAAVTTAAISASVAGPQVFRLWHRTKDR